MKKQFLLLFVSLSFAESYEYEKQANKQCPEAKNNQFQMGKTQAISKCNSDPSCFAIYDRGCSGQNFLICQNEERWEKYPRAQQSRSSCIYMKPKCADGYDQLINGSDYCYKIVTKKETWQSAKEKCANENAELACFGNEMERDLLASKCDGCWVGYQWQGGAWMHANVNDVVEPGIPKIPKHCPNNVVSGRDWRSMAGTCARTWTSSSNKLISYVCDRSTFSYPYICQKGKFDVRYL